MGKLWDRQTGTTRARRLAVVAAMGLLAVGMMALPSQAVIGGFEAGDGNLDNDGNVDWNDFSAFYTRIVAHTGATTSVNTSPVAGFDQLTWVQDRTGNPDDLFSGGVKQDHDCPSTTTGSLGGGNSKFDLDRIYLTHTVSGTDDFLYLAWVRVPQNSTTASAHVAFEFNKGTGSCNGLIPRTPGDKLIVYDFEGGSGTASFPSLKLLDWTTNPAHTCEVSNNKPPCWRFLADLNATGSEGRVNTVDIGTVRDDIRGEDLGPVRFGEAGINLSTIAGVDPCDFSGHVTGVSRSSGNSGTAQMKDKVGPAVFTLPNCITQPAITTLISLNDQATLNPFDTSSDGTGTLTFKLHGPSDPTCAGAPVYQTVVSSINGPGPWTTAQGNNVLKAYVVPANAQGAYNWVVSYSGDDRNASAVKGCGSETALVTYS